MFNFSDSEGFPRLDVEADAEVDSRKPGILVIEEDLNALVRLTAALLRRGFAVWRALNAEEAALLFRARRGAIDLVLASNDLPDTAGSDLIASLQRIDPTLRFCSMSEFFSGGEQDELLELGASWLFPKPFPAEAVVERLWRLAHLWRVDRHR